MPNCNFNGCFTGPNYPRRIFTCNCNNQGCGGGRVVNPTVPIEFAVFKSEDVSVDGGQVIPVVLTDSSGTAITDGGSGEVSLTAGTYRVSYNTTFEIPEGTQVGTVLALDGTAISTTESIVTGTAGQVSSTSNQIIITVTGNQVLTLVNSTGERVNFISVNLSVDKL